MKHLEEKIVKEFEDKRFDIETWMRNYGVDDEQTLTPEEVQEMLEAYHVKLSTLLRISLATYKEGVREKVEGMIKDGVNVYDTCVEHNYVGTNCPECAGFNAALDAVKALLQ